MTKLGWPPQTRSAHLVQYVHMKTEVNWNTWRQVIKKASHPWSQSYLAMPELEIYRSLNNIVPFNVVSLQNIDGKRRKKKKSQPDRYVELAHSRHGCMGFLWAPQLLPHPSNIQERWTGLSTSSWSECVFECECVHTRTRTHPTGRASCLGLVPTSHPKLPG